MELISKENEFLQIKKEDYELALVKCGVTNKAALDSIASIKEWYKMQLHFPEEIFPDHQLFSFLLINNFSLERTKQKIDNLLTARTLLPEIISDRDPHTEHMQTALQYCSSGVIPIRLDDMTRINIFGFRCEDASKFKFEDYMRVVATGHELLVFLDLCLGNHYIVDWKGLHSVHVTQMSAALIMKGLFIFTECYGTKTKSIHFINVPTYAEWILSLVKIALSNKMSSRVHVHKNPEDLHNFFPKNLLPSDFGGECKSLKELTQDCIEAMFQHRDYILLLDRLKSDESKRVGVSNAMSEELQGMQGSFRNLDID